MVVKLKDIPTISSGVTFRSRIEAIADFFSLSLKEQYLLAEIKYRKALYTQGILMQITSAPRLTASNKKPDFNATVPTPSQNQIRSNL